MAVKEKTVRKKAFADMREWIDWLEEQGQLRRVNAEVDWNLEIGGLARAVQAVEGPALLFENIKDYKNTRGRRLMVGGLANYPRIAAMLGLALDTPLVEMVRQCRRLFREQVRPMMVATGPVKDNIVTGDAVDLFQFPVPKWHHLDGGRYIDTFAGVVTKDPDTGEVNVGMYRGMIVGKNKIAKLMVPAQHWGGHFLKYQAMGKPMPLAVVHGWDDAMPFCACTPIPHHQSSEWDIIGAIRGEPVRLVKCETVDLEVPANAEIVVEGTMSADPSTFEMEGPFGEYTGWCEGKASPKPVLNVQCITYRNNPILRGSAEGARAGMPNEDTHIYPISLSAVAWNVLEDAGVRGITDVWCTPITMGTTTIVQIHKQFRGHAHQVAGALWSSSASNWFYKTIIVVEEDIDIRSWEDIDWAIAYRVNAGEPGDLTIFGPTGGSVLDPSTRWEDRNPILYGTGKWHRVLVDATRNWDFPRREEFGGHMYPPVNKLGVTTEKLIFRRWKEYGLGIPYLTDDQREKLTMERLIDVLPVVGKE
ncbi:MAG TPA: UbiD family decarboxylase [Syntrophales bacterium]|nr:UbiD family decarboxylase [Syntrophales bacterium]